MEARLSDVRQFNRVVTQRVGALQDSYLGRGRPIGESRVLWEIGEGGCEIRLLRARLDLDSGYLSRLLRSLESAGLVAVGPSAADGRVREARLTRKGRVERAILDRRSDELAASMLAPLNAAQQERLVTAMGEVERLLTAALVEVSIVDPGHPDVTWCLAQYFGELDRRFTSGFDLSVALASDPSEFRPPTGQFLVAYLHGAAVGCGALKLPAGGTAEIKRMWVDPEARGLGVGRRLMAELESRAAEHSALVRLDTNSSLVEAIVMYRSSGYVEIADFNGEPHAQHWFEKHVRPG